MCYTTDTIVYSHTAITQCHYSIAAATKIIK